MPATVTPVTAPQTGTIHVPASGGVAPVRTRLRSASTAIRVAAVRTPELTVGALGVVSGALFAWVPSLWYDEAATVTSATRSWPQLWAELQNVDAVHGLYYALVHAWFWLVGYTPFTLRFPSALAIGVTAGLVVALGRRLGGRRLGIAAGLVFLALPRVQWAGSEGRPYATVTTLAVALTLVGITAVRRTRGGAPSGSSVRWWVAYGVLAFLAVGFNVYLALAVVAHAVTLAWTFLVERRRASWTRRPGTDGGPLVTRTALVRWTVATGAAALVVSPLVLEVMAQSKQVAWISGIGDRTFSQVFATAWFGGIDSYATVAWALLVIGAGAGLVAAHRRSPTARALLRAQAVRIALPLALLPTGVLLTVTALGKHLYSPKYASLSLPFVALLIALAITAVRPRAVIAAVLAVFLVISVPSAIDVKTPRSKQESTWANAASIIAAERGSNTGANEGVVFGSVYGHPGATAEIIRVSYPWAFTGLTDLGMRKNGAETGVLWNQNGELASTIPARLGDIDTVWFVGGTPKARNIQPETTAVLAEHGFHVEQKWRTGRVVITEFVRD